MNHHFRRYTLMSGLCAIALLGSSATLFATSDRDPERVAAQFDEIMKRLDPGGDLILIANVEGMVEQVAERLIGFMESIPGDADLERGREALAQLHAYLKKSGMYAVNGFGISVVPRDDGLNTIKWFISRDASAAALPLWRGFFGFKQRRLASLDFLPADAAVVEAVNCEPAQIWAFVRDAIGEIAPAEAVAAFNQWRNLAGLMLGHDLNALIDSLGDEIFISIQLSADETITIPVPDLMLEIPKPSILFGIALKDETLPNLIAEQLASASSPLTRTQVGDTTLQTILVPVPLGIPIAPTYAVHDGFLLIGSDVSAVRDAVGAAVDKNGLASTKEFQDAFEGLPMVNNGISYVNRRVSTVLKDVRDTVYGKMADDEGMGPEGGAMISQVQELIGWGGRLDAAFVRLNLKSGVVTQGRSAQSKREMITSFAIMPIGMMAAIAIPSFMKSRTVSQQNACINNLRQIESAKEQWAMANNQSDGDLVDVDEAAMYLRGSLIPDCPKGGTYSINPVGTTVTCTEPEHVLP